MSAAPALVFAPELTLVDGGAKIVHPFIAGLPMTCGTCGAVSQANGRLPYGFQVGGWFCTFACLDAHLIKRHGPRWWLISSTPGATAQGRQ